MSEEGRRIVSPCTLVLANESVGSSQQFQDKRHRAEKIRTAHLALPFRPCPGKGALGAPNNRLPLEGKRHADCFCRPPLARLSAISIGPRVNSPFLARSVKSRK